MPDLYAILEVSSDASQEELKRAYRQKARECHPDAGGTEEDFKAVTHAYEVLSDPQKRRRYDRYGDDGTPRTRGAGAQDPFGFGGGLDDVIDAFFGTAFGQRGGGRGRRAQSGRDVLVPLELTLEEVATGTQRSVDVEVAVTCEECGGGGAASGAGPSRCSTCEGSGRVQRVMRTAFGQLATASQCPDCDGSGYAPTDPCRVCGGEGRRVRERTVSVEVPAGVDEGDRLKVAGAGEAGKRGAASGDLYVEIRLVDHRLYERDGRDLHGEVTVPFVQAALGSVVVVPGIQGDEIEIDVPPGTQPGDVVSVRGMGLPRRGSTTGRGSLHLHVQVEVPTDLDSEQRELVRRLAELRGEAVSERGRGLMARLREALQ